jgi:hypothetical protein
MDAKGSPFVFVTHKCVEHALVYGVLNELESRGIRCWIDKRDIHVGTDWADEIQEHLYGAAAVLWIRTPLSTTSNEILKELKLASMHGQRIVPLEVDPAVKLQPKWDAYSLLQTISFSDSTWADNVVRELLDLDAFAASPALAKRDASPAPVVVSPTQSNAATKIASTTAAQHDAFAIVSNDDLTYQLDGLNGLGESLVQAGDPFVTADLGTVTVSSDGSVIATINSRSDIELWTLGSDEGIAGPALSADLPGEGGEPRLLAVDRPLGQVVRVIACRKNAAYSLMQRMDGAWTAMQLIDGDEPIVAGVVVKDDVLFVRASGDTVWASTRSKRPFSLPKIDGVDAALGTDGRYYLAGWGKGADGSSEVEVVVEAEAGWERVHRGPGGRAGIVRVLPDVVRQTPGATQTSLAVEQGERSVEILALP